MGHYELIYLKKVHIIINNCMIYQEENNIIWSLYNESKLNVVNEGRKVPDIYPRLNHAGEAYDFSIKTDSFADLESQFYKSLDEDLGGGIHIEEQDKNRLYDEIFGLNDVDKDELIELYGEEKYQAMLKSGREKSFPLYTTSVDIEATNTQTNEPESMNIEFTYVELTDWFSNSIDSKHRPLFLAYTFNEDSEFKEKLRTGTETQAGIKRKKRTFKY